jgi:hypothetical protein
MMAIPKSAKPQPAAKKQPFQAQLTRPQREAVLSQVSLHTYTGSTVVKYTAPCLTFYRDEIAKLTEPNDLLVIRIEPETANNKRGYERGYYVFTLKEFQDQLVPSKSKHWHNPPFHFQYMAAPAWLQPAFISIKVLKTLGKPDPAPAAAAPVVEPIQPE